jgi:CRP-like cAMP-binding protein
MVNVSFKAGDTIFLEREPGDALFVVESGGMRIWLRDSRPRNI